MTTDDTFFAHIRAWMNSAADQGITVVPCARCGTPCKMNKAPNPDARLMAYATPETVEAKRGLCVDCAATEIFKVFLEANQLFQTAPQSNVRAA